MADKDLLEGKRILLVDDEPDVLDTLEDLLPMCETVTASNFDEAKELLETQYFDMTVLDIMGVEGFKLLEIANQ
ncbi:MAG: response regulator, partial [Deltaproteobacteria bacterium]|nr:response regulator [Deltaproteobacteria bacterium]